jgi:hypothetical protein
LELFSAFATVNEFAPEVTTVAQGVGNLYTAQKSKGCTALDSTKVKVATAKALTEAEAKADKSTVITVYDRTLARLKSLPFPLHAVSGKNFLLPLLEFLLHSHGSRTKRKSLRMRMVSAGDINRFTNLHDALNRAALGY